MSALLVENIYRITVDQYHQMIEAGALTTDDKCELLDGYLCKKKLKTPLLCATVTMLRTLLGELINPELYAVRQFCPITLQTSEPEPDIVLVPSYDLEYCRRHPSPREVSLVVEIAEASLPIDRTTKLQLYAQAAIPQYWIINLVEKFVEVYTLPSDSMHDLNYRRKRIYLRNEIIPLDLSDNATVMVPVEKFMLHKNSSVSLAYSGD